MAQVKADEISPIATEPPQNPPENAIIRTPSTSTAAPLERRSSNVANTLRSTEEGISVKSKLHAYTQYHRGSRRVTKVTKRRHVPVVSKPC